MSYPAFPDVPKLCVVRALKAYEVATVDIRPQSVRQLFITLTKPHGAVSTPTIERWVSWVMQEAGIVTPHFRAHSVRGAMASKAFSLGVRLEDILNAADWSPDSTFKRFYFKPLSSLASLVVDKP